jgi:formylglycine-generating enzyme required for sulfatase activity
MRPVFPIAAAALLLAAPLVRAQRPSRSAPVIDRVLIPAGPFIMGADERGEPDERPRHTMELPAYLIDRTEVTRGDYHRCEGAGVCTSPRPLDARFRDPRQPIVGVSWHQARAYCAWARGRLPTEAEWEKAARGPQGRMFPWGDEYPNGTRAVYGRREETGHPDPVGSRPRGDSPYGLHDMAGNVWEWVESPYDPYAYRTPSRAPTCESALAALSDLRTRGVRGFTGSNPLPTECERILRGGGWNYGGEGLRSSNRVHHPANYRLVMSGFRCAADVAPGS